MKHLQRRQLLLTKEDSELEASGSASDKTDHRPSFSALEKNLLQKDDEPVGILSVLLTTVTMVTYTMDVSSSAVLCYWLYDVRKWWWWMTVGPLLTSLVVVNGFSMRWYVHDAHEEAKDHLPSVTAGHWTMRGMFHLVLLGPLIRYAELFLYGVHTCDKKDPKRHQYRLMFLQEDRDVSLLTLVGSFIKSAPQLVLQMYIFTQSRIPINIHTSRTQAVNIVTSLVQLSLAQSAYHRALRRSSPLKHNMTKIGTFVQFFSHCCVIASRVLALASFATVFEHWTLVFCGVHWCLMTSWLVLMRTNFCASTSGQPRPLEEFVFNVVVGVIYVFCFVNVKDEPTRWKYATYYFLIGIENLVLVILWYLYADRELWFRVPLLTAVILCLAVGLACLVAYYVFLHPNKLWKKLHEKNINED
ncbi:hypothetical protein JTE90_028419 [Oedothorax gibbosus]|uniref:XK-related protein n=1 Tax=Oedothorax gibbosus TaxID=931172 RepID=A0AAV6VGQ0_9ARAC|nr:hypothetical protein JTE90_028419 [Oedothorax gibbosus]